MKSYSIDPFRMSMERYYQLIRAKKLLPGRRILLDEAETRFRVLTELGIDSLGALLSALKNKGKLADISIKSGIPEDYLLILKREAGSYLSRPFPLSNFPGIPFEYTEILKSKGYHNTKEFFEAMLKQEDFEILSKQTGIPVYRLKEIYELSDLSRINGVGGLFASFLHQAGTVSVQQFAELSPADREKMLQVKISAKDIQFCVDYAGIIMEMEAGL